MLQKNFKIYVFVHFSFKFVFMQHPCALVQLVHIQVVAKIQASISLYIVC